MERDLGMVSGGDRMKGGVYLTRGIILIFNINTMVSFHRIMELYVEEKFGARSKDNLMARNALDYITWAPKESVDVKQELRLDLIALREKIDRVADWKVRGCDVELIVAIDSWLEQ